MHIAYHYVYQHKAKMYVFIEWQGKPLENMIYENVWGYFLIHFYVMRSGCREAPGDSPTYNKPGIKTQLLENQRIYGY